MRRVALGAAVAVAVVLVLLGHTFGRAQTAHTYRPDLAPAALDNGCYPLPTGLRLTFPYQVRSDGDQPRTPGSLAGSRRHLMLQFDLMTLDQARSRLLADFTDAGFRVVGEASGDRVVLRRPDTGRVVATLATLPKPVAGAVVGGTITLDLPSITLQGDGLACDDPYSTKRFPAGWQVRHL